MTNVRNAIVAANETFMAAFKRNDAAGVAALYTKDAILLPPNSPMMSGTAAIQSFWQGAMNMGIKEARLETVEVEARDDRACEVGQYTLTIQPEGSTSKTETGKYIVVWKHDGGTWKLHRDIWNTSAPA